MANTSPTITVIAGPNGSGKTRLSETLISDAWIPANAYINPDHIAREYAATDVHRGCRWASAGGLLYCVPS